MWCQAGPGGCGDSNAYVPCLGLLGSISVPNQSCKFVQLSAESAVWRQLVKHAGTAVVQAGVLSCYRLCRPAGWWLCVWCGKRDTCESSRTLGGCMAYCVLSPRLGSTHTHLLTSHAEACLFARV